MFLRESSEAGRRQPEGVEPQTAVVVRRIVACRLSQSGSNRTWTTQSAVRPLELVKGSSGFCELAVLPSRLIFFFETNLILSIWQQPSVPHRPLPKLFYSVTSIPLTPHALVLFPFIIFSFLPHGLTLTPSYTIPCLAMPYHSLKYHTIPYCTILYYTILYYTMLCHTLLYHTIL